MAEESTKVVYAALVGNVLVALCKFGAAFLSASSAMLTEAIHSTADTVNQLLLLADVGPMSGPDSGDCLTMNLTNVRNASEPSVLGN